MTLPAQRERWLLWSLAGLQFTHILDFMIMMPLGPMFLRELHIDTRHFGLLVSAYTFAAAAAGLLAATVIDRFERRKLLLTVYVLFAVATLLCALAPGYWTFLAARCAAGTFGGVLGSLVFTVIGENIPQERRGRATGLVMASFSLSTVAGVPLGLWLANLFSWRAPFVFIGVLCVVFFTLAWRSLPYSPPRARSGGSFAAPLFSVLRDANHLRAFAFMSLMMWGGFSVIPFITLYMTANVKLPEPLLPLVYLAGGACTFFTSRWFGRLADRYGKARTFRFIALASLVPLFTLTHLSPVPVAVALLVTTAFFVLISGRMVPGMALITSAANPELRGTFMSLNSSVQQLASGMASFAAGHFISRNSAGEVVGYGWVGLVAVFVTLLAMAMVGQVKVRG